MMRPGPRSVAGRSGVEVELARLFECRARLVEPTLHPAERPESRSAPVPAAITPSPVRSRAAASAASAASSSSRSSSSHCERRHAAHPQVASSGTPRPARSPAVCMSSARAQVAGPPRCGCEPAQRVGSCVDLVAPGSSSSPALRSRAASAGSPSRSIATSASAVSARPSSTASPASRASARTRSISEATAVNSFSARAAVRRPDSGGRVSARARATGGRGGGRSRTTSRRSASSPACWSAAAASCASSAGDGAVELLDRAAARSRWCARISTRSSPPRSRASPRTAGGSLRARPSSCRRRRHRG